MGLQALESQSMSQPQPQNQNWTDWGRQKFQTARHYMPSWHYAPAVGAGLLGGVVAPGLIASGLEGALGYYITGGGPFGTGPRKAIANTYSLIPLYALVPALIAAGWTLKQIEQFVRDIKSDPGSYKYYLPGIIAALGTFSPPYGNGNSGWRLLPWLASPLLLGAGHLAHQYNYPPVAPVNNQRQFPVDQPEQLPLIIQEGQ